MLGVVYDVPVAKEAPPVAAAYQLIIPAAAVAPRVTVPASHRAAGVVPVIVVLLTVAIIAVRDAVVHIPSDAST